MQSVLERVVGFLLLGLELKLLSVEHVASWAAACVADSSEPNPLHCDLAMVGPGTTHYVVDTLQQMVPDVPPASDVLPLLMAYVGRELRENRLSCDRGIKSMYRAVVDTGLDWEQRFYPVIQLEAEYDTATHPPFLGDPARIQEKIQAYLAGFAEREPELESIRSND